MRRKTYKRRDEVLFRDRLPDDGQRIAYRGYAQKSYRVGRYDASRRVIVISYAGQTEEIFLDGKHGGVIAFGWSPLAEPPKE